VAHLASYPSPVRYQTYIMDLLQLIQEPLNSENFVQTSSMIVDYADLEQLQHEGKKEGKVESPPAKLGSCCRLEILLKISGKRLC
jgi:hypothetical protein